MSLQSQTHWTPAQYLAFERSHAERHELIDGRIVLQAGGSRNHAVIGTNLVSSLHSQLRSRSCSVFGSDMRVAIPKLLRYVYPDVSVACDLALFEDEHQDTLINPTVIIEILSPSTERYDRGKKFQAYQSLDSFQEYILVAQDSVLVEHFVRRSDSIWTFEVVTERDELVTLASIQCILRLDDIYEKIVFTEQE